MVIAWPIETSNDRTTSRFTCNICQEHLPKRLAVHDEEELQAALNLILRLKRLNL